MPGPCSVPNGDSDLVRNNLVCFIHGEKMASCEWTKVCKKVTLREFLYQRNLLVTGKTRVNRDK